MTVGRYEYTTQRDARGRWYVIETDMEAGAITWHGTAFDAWAQALHEGAERGRRRNHRKMEAQTLTED